MIVSLIFANYWNLENHLYIIIHVRTPLNPSPHIDIQRLHDIQSVNIVVNL